jgi:membrane protein implicated in regulation of membrane protease activity
VAYAALCFKKAGTELRVFSYFIFFSGIIQFLSLLLWFLGKNNMPLLHIYVAAGFLLLAWFYRTLLRNFINPKNNMVYGHIIFSIYHGQLGFFPEHFHIQFHCVNR